MLLIFKYIRSPREFGVGGPESQYPVPIFIYPRYIGYPLKFVRLKWPGAVRIMGDEFLYSETSYDKFAGFDRALFYTHRIVLELGDVEIKKLGRTEDVAKAHKILGRLVQRQIDKNLWTE